MNLKWNYDGRGFKTPSEENLDFVKGKRDELYALWFTTAAAVVLGTIGLAFVRGHATKDLIMWIFIYNILGLVFGYVISSMAK